MKIINYGSNYEIYPDDLKTFDKLPAGTYKVNFHPMSGFSLLKTDNFESIEDKIYGNHSAKIQKVLSSFSKFQRSLGIILSGEKGMGKSLFTQLLAEEVIKLGMPVIMVNKAYKGIADFLDKIDQEVLVIFDEFEKVFSIDGEKGQGESQNDLLGLFDGTSQKKRLYAITVNKLHKLSEFMVSRTGRFHYHIRFDYPTPDEIEIYLKDKLESQYYGEIKHVISFASKVQLNYDSLRAIAFEINEGHTFSSAIGDLNILATDSQRYDVKVHLSNGSTVKLNEQRLNLFSEQITLNGYTDDGNWFSARFETSKASTTSDGVIVNGEDVNFSMNLDDSDEDYAKYKGVNASGLTISLHKAAGVNYQLAV